MPAWRRPHRPRSDSGGVATRNANVKAIELRPGYGNAHHWHALSLGTRGRPEEALREIRRAQELDPLSPSVTCNVAAPYFDEIRSTPAYQAGLERIGLADV